MQRMRQRTQNLEGLDEFEPKEPPISRREADADPVDLNEMRVDIREEGPS